MSYIFVSKGVTFQMIYDAINCQILFIVLKFGITIGFCTMMDKVWFWKEESAVFCFNKNTKI